MNKLKQYFEFEHLNTNFRKETTGGITTFLAMCYILVVNPSILKVAGMDANAVFVSTALTAAFGTLFMGLVARYPIAMAPGMGLNAFFAFTVVLSMGFSWQTALSGVLAASLLFAILTITGLREKIIAAIPYDLKLSVGVGIGLFIAFIGLQNAGIITGSKATLVELGDLHSPAVLLAIFGLVITMIMMVRKINGAVFYGMVLTTIIGILFKEIPMPDKIIGSVPSLEPTFGAAFDAFAHHFSDQILTKNFAIVVFTLLFVQFFDCAGTFISVASQAGLVENNRFPRPYRALMADSFTGVVGAILGTSSITSYIESSSGVAAGARSGFASVITGLLFILSLFFSPLLSIVTPAVTAPALIIVGVLMTQAVAKINWNQLEIAIPAFITILTMPLSYGITNGIALGFITYPITMIAAGRRKEVHMIMYILAVVFLLFFIVNKA